MKKLMTLVTAGLVFALCVPTMVLAGKKKQADVAAVTAVSPYTSGAATLNHPGRLLASNCFQCHGTNGHGMESLAGKAAREIAEELLEMQQETAGKEMMNVHAKGYTPEQIKLIADYFSRQQP